MYQARQLETFNYCFVNSKTDGVVIIRSWKDIYRKLSTCKKDCMYNVHVCGTKSEVWAKTDLCFVCVTERDQLGTCTCVMSTKKAYMYMYMYTSKRVAGTVHVVQDTGEVLLRNSYM